MCNVLYGTKSHTSWAIRNAIRRRNPGRSTNDQLLDRVTKISA